MPTFTSIAMTIAVITAHQSSESLFFGLMLPALPRILANSKNIRASKAAWATISLPSDLVRAGLTTAIIRLPRTKKDEARLPAK
jgi:hypothetical protein